MMYQQNQMFRDKGLGNWGDLVTAVAQDPAMLVYLDNATSKADAPNENFARELMELFTLGEGQYSEDDIKEAARAFTGWMVERRSYAFMDLTALKPQRPSAIQMKSKIRDDDRKTFFGQSGNLTGNDIIRIILEQEQSSKFMMAKIWTFFAYDNPEPELVEALARIFRENNYEIAPTLKTLFMSDAFYSEKAVRTQIKSPVLWLAGSCIALDIELPSMRFSAAALQALGQVLFLPPNVKGWDGGYAWITTSTLTQRYNLAGTLINMRQPSQEDRPMQRRRFMGQNYLLNTSVILPPEKRSSVATALQYLSNRIYQARLPESALEPLKEHLRSLPEPSEWTDEQIRNILHLMMSSPQYQLT